MFTVCVGLVFRSKYVQFPIICSLLYSININTVEIDPQSDLLHICIVKPKNTHGYICDCPCPTCNRYDFHSVLTSRPTLVYQNHSLENTSAVCLTNY